MKKEQKIKPPTPSTTPTQASTFKWDDWLDHLTSYMNLGGDSVDSGTRYISEDVKTLPPPRVPAVKLASVPSIIVTLPLIENSSATLSLTKESSSFHHFVTFWLHYYLGNLPELEGSPIVGQVWNKMTPLYSGDLGIGIANALALRRRFDTTYMVHSVVSPTKKQCLYSVYGRNDKIIATVPFSGDDQSLLRALPQIAWQIASACKSSADLLPKNCAENFEEALSLGKFIHIKYTMRLSEEMKESFVKLSEKSDIAAILLTYRPKIAFKLLKRSSRNSNIWAYIADNSMPVVLSKLPSLVRLQQENPNNYALAFTLSKCYRVTGEIRQEQLHSLEAIRIAPHNVHSWLRFYTMVSEQASIIRKGRMAANISDKEWLLLNALYEAGYQACENATRVDPQYGQAWLSLAEAGTFASKDRRAREAFLQAEKWHPDKLSVYKWGFQMFQPKWGGTEEEMETCIKKAMAWQEKEPYRFAAAQLHELLYSINVVKPADAFIAKEAKKLQKQLSQTTNNPQLYYDYARCLHLTMPYGKDPDPKVFSEVEQNLKKAALLSNEPDIFLKWLMLNNYSGIRNYKFSLVEGLQYCISKNQKYKPFYYILADNFRRTIINKKEEEKNIYLKLLTMNPSDSYANYQMGRFYSDERRLNNQKSDNIEVIKYFSRLDIDDLKDANLQRDYFDKYMFALSYQSQVQSISYPSNIHSFPNINEMKINLIIQILDRSYFLNREERKENTHLLPLLYMDLKKYQEACDFFTNFLKEFGNDTGEESRNKVKSAKTGIGSALYNLGRKKEAHDMWNKMIQEYPEDKSSLERMLKWYPLD
jgi:hypothetical protein